MVEEILQQIQAFRYAFYNRRIEIKGLDSLHSNLFLTTSKPSHFPHDS